MARTKSSLPQPNAEQAAVRPPGEGERLALRGYVPQYDSSAAAIYASLERGLEWVGVADRRAGIADDVVLGFAGRVVGHQFKTAQFPDMFRLQTLLCGENGFLLPLIAAWKSLKHSNPGQTVEICLVTNDYPSKKDSLTEAKGAKKSRQRRPKRTSTEDGLTETQGTHSALFLSEFEAHPARTLAEWRATRWQPWVDKLCKDSGLEEQEFELFLQSLKILHSAAANFFHLHRLPPESKRLVRKIADLLPRLVADKRDKDRWTRAELLDELGWRDTTRTQHVHQFPVGIHVQRNEATERELRDAILQNINGYVSLVGPPGVGKSTLLQVALETESNMAVVRYLAYVPSVGQGVGRGEAEDFLDDLNTEFKKTGLSGLRFRDDSLHERRAQFNALLLQAGERFAHDEVRTIVVVDGLDHVSREEKPQRSFLMDLPLPQAVPEGVLFVLGTQKLDLKDIPLAVQEQAGVVGRKITVHPLSREAIYRIADSLGLDQSIDRDRVFELSKGHPLLTRYLVEALREADETTCGKLLAGSMQFDGDIEVVYNSAWRNIRDDEQVRNVLDYLARAEGPMPLELLAEKIHEEAIEHALKATKHLLNKDSHGWTVFHNSFRLFILDKPKMRLGSPDRGYNKRIYQELADLARRAPNESQQRWLELRYLARAEEYTAVLDLATPERFRQQLAKHRSFAELRADLRLAFRAVRHHYDPTKVFQLMLIQDEMDRRWEAYEDARSIPEALLHVGDLDAAVAFVEQFPDKGYQVVDALICASEIPRAHALFNSFEPLQLLLSEPSNNDLWIPELEEWARRVIHFRDDEQILRSIDRVAHAARLPVLEINNEEEVKALVAHLRCEVVLAIMDARDDVDVAAESQRFKLDAAGFITVLLQAGLTAAESGANDVALVRIREAFEHAAFLKAPNALRRGAALIVAKNGDLSLAAEIYRGLKTPAIAELDRYIEDEASKHVVRSTLEHAELTTILGRKTSAIRKSEHQALRPLQSHATAVGKLLGRAHFSPTKIHSGEVASAARVTLTYLGRVQPEGPSEFYAFHQIDAAAPLFGKALIQAAWLCGEQEFSATIAEFDEAFAQSGNLNSSRMNLRREVAVQIFRCTGNTEEASRRLEPLVQALQGDTPAQQIGDLADLAVSFAQVGNKLRAKELLARIPKESLGYARPPKKDSQYVLWRKLLQNANQAQPEKRSDRVAFLLRQVAGMLQTEGHHSIHLITQVLLEEAMLCDSTMGWWSGRFLVDELDGGVISWAQLVDALMLGLVKRKPDMALIATLTWCELALPYYMEPHYNESRLGTFVSAAIELATSENVSAVVDILLPAIETEAQAHERVELLDRMLQAAMARGLATKAIEDSRARWNAEAPPPRRPYTPMRYDDVSTLGELKAQLEKDASTDNFGHEAPDAFNRLATKENFALAKEVFDRWEPIRKNSRARFTVIDLAIADGQLDVAHQLMEGYKIDTDERFPGWTAWTGKSLQLYFRTKLKLEGAGVYREAYDNFVRGLEVDQEFLRFALFEHDDIFPILTQSPDWVKMWDSLAEQLATTREYAIGTTFGVDDCKQMSDDELIVSLFIWALNLSVPEVHRHAISGALRLLPMKGGSSVFVQIVRRLLDGEADHPTEGLQLLLLETEDSLTPQLADKVIELTQHADFAVAEMATILARRWGLSPSRKMEPLSSYYSLVLEDRGEFNRSLLVDAEAGPMRIEDPLGWTDAFENQIEFLTGSGVSSSHIRHRSRIFIEQWGGLEAFGTEATRRLTSDLRKIEMALPYTYPHIVVAARALRYVAGELRRGGAVSDEVVAALLYFMGYPMPQSPLILPVPRPAFILRPSLGEAAWHIKEENWMKGVNDDVARLRAGNDTILAEVSKFHIHRSYRTFHMKRIRAPGLTANSAMQVDELKLPRAIWVGYPVPNSPEPARTIARCLSEQFSFKVPEFQLIICPHWLRKLEWHSHFNNELIYLDSSNAIVARRIWWRDGGPVHIRDDVIWSEGMLLSLTPKGRQQIEALKGSLRVEVWARRDCGEPGSQNKQMQGQVAFSID